jgi:MFS superfamily sulfate permease-like transporter
LKQEKLLPTALVAVALSVVINGIFFVVLGYFKLGNLLHYFPRYVILGMNAGFGVFLVLTAFEISTTLPFSLANAKVLTNDMIMQLMMAVFLELILRLIAFSGVNEILNSALMLLIPVFFYVGVFLLDVPLSVARQKLWLFEEAGSGGEGHWWRTWDAFDLVHVDLPALCLQLPTIGLLALFTMILVPVRIPSLALITNEEVVFDRELIAQGVGNILAGLLGCPHNYLSYSNSIFFHVLHGKGQGSRLVLSLLTLLLFFQGAQLLNFVPRMIASLIMIHLGVDLLIASLLENSRTLTFLEFCCLLFVAVIVSIFGFVVGMSTGILLACVTFVISSSREQNIRSIFAGHEARSDTQWTVKQAQKLSKAIDQHTVQVYVIELQGHLFFGNVQRVLGELTQLIDPLAASPQQNEQIRRKYSVLRSRGLTIDSQLDEETSFFSLSLSASAAGAGASRSFEAHYFQAEHTTERHPHGCHDDDEEAAPNVTRLVNVVLDCTFLAGADINAISGLYKFKQRYENMHLHHLGHGHSSPANSNGPQYGPRASQSHPHPPSHHHHRDHHLLAQQHRIPPQYQIVFAGLLPSLAHTFELIDRTEKAKQRLKEQRQRETTSPRIHAESSSTSSFSDFPPPPPPPPLPARAHSNPPNETSPLLPPLSKTAGSRGLTIQPPPLSGLSGEDQYGQPLHLLGLPSSFFPDVNSALHAIEEELLRVVPESPTFSSPDAFYREMLREIQLGEEFDEEEDEEEEGDGDELELFDVHQLHQWGEGVGEEDGLVDDFYSHLLRHEQQQRQQGQRLPRVSPREFFQRNYSSFPEAGASGDNTPSQHGGGGGGSSRKHQPSQQLALFSASSSQKLSGRGGTKSRSSSTSEGMGGQYSPILATTPSGGIASPSIKSIKFVHQKKKKLLGYFDQLGSHLWEPYERSYLEELATKLLYFPVAVYQKDQTIWEKGSEATQLGLLIEGKICSQLANGTSFQTMIPPGLVGLSAIVKEKTHSRTLVASVSQTKIILIPQAFLRDLEQKHRHVYSVLSAMAPRSLYFRQKSDFSLFHAGSISNLKA